MCGELATEDTFYDFKSAGEDSGHYVCRRNEATCSYDDGKIRTLARPKILMTLQHAIRTPDQVRQFRARAEEKFLDKLWFGNDTN